MGSLVRVAVVDSGVNAKHPHLAGVKLGECYSAWEPGGEVFDWMGHGTAVAAAIAEKAPEAELLIVKVFDKGLRTTVEILERGLRWAIGQKVDVINLSLGTTNEEWRGMLKGLMSEAAAAGVRVVAAYRAGEKLCLPGSLPGVIGVVSEGEEGVEGVVVASPFAREIPGVPKERNLHGVSFAVANATGALARELGRQR